MHIYDFTDNEIDADIIHELKHYLINTKKTSILLITGIACIIFGVCLIFNLINSLRDFTILIVIYVVLLLFSPFLTKKLSDKVENNLLMKFKEIKNSDSIRSSVFFDDNGIYVNISNNLIAYNNFTRILLTKSTITLSTKAGTIVIVRTDKIDIQKKEDALNFLKERCINASIVSS